MAPRRSPDVSDIDLLVSRIQPPKDSSAEPGGLPPEIERIVTTAMSKFTPELWILAAYCKNNNSLGRYPQVIKVFFHHLKTVPPRQFKNENDCTDLELAAIALDGILTVMLSPSNIDNGSYFMQHFTLSWGAIWKWMKCVYAQDQNGTIGRRLKRVWIRDIIHIPSPSWTILRIISYFFFDPSSSVYKALGATPGVFLMLVDIWDKMSEKFCDDERFPLDCCATFVAILDLVTLDASRVQLLVDVLHGDMGKVASLFLKAISLVSHDGEKWNTAFVMVVTVTTSITLLMPGLFHALLSQNGMIVITQALVRFSTLPISTSMSSADNPMPEIPPTPSPSSTSDITSMGRTWGIPNHLSVSLEYFYRTFSDFMPNIVSMLTPSFMSVTSLEGHTLGVPNVLFACLDYFQAFSSSISNTLTMFFPSTWSSRSTWWSRSELGTAENLYACLDYIQQATNTTDGFTWIIQAVRSGLIPAILRSTQWSSREVDATSIFLFVTIEKYLVYRSVLRVVDRALQDPAIALLESKIPRSGNFRTHWTHFKNFVKTRMEAKAAFDEIGKYTQTCSAPECNKLEDGEGFRHCSACQLACYCSKVCQQRDWKKGNHRTECETLRNDRAKGISSPISPRDEAFFLFLSTYEMKKYRQEIINMRDQSRSMTRLPFRPDFILYVNHSYIPPLFDTMTHASFLQSIGPGVQCREPSKDHGAVLFPRTADMSVNSTVVDLQVKVPYGATELTMLFRSDAACSLFGWH